MRNLFILALLAGVLTTLGGQARAEQPAAVGGLAASESAPRSSSHSRDASAMFYKLPVSTGPVAHTPAVPGTIAG
ncbi:hypothetical protein IZ6_18280 [Terrihabitans soli]|uniref:Uncharacterized protein n=1 Tax=Terrihabitans soli TaxID=708113 RepID=A0A6S6QIL6_9HYPH|nr:hypothetical protein [Terrihabitans soli]BCJ91093.1 hypothetical protein IZ6_18280 [Terrihabitans soli]